ncbi:DNA/RNA non-specific endonuclease [Flavipsychrobacter stenotrophus]|nr:DNA/RNA non-specific endonuclease [Flavipsychrobacter stenotrophus]
MRKNVHRFVAPILMAGLFILLQLFSGNSFAQVSLTNGSATYTQNFNTLASSGTPAWSNNTTIVGWYAAQGVGTLSTYITGTGSGTGAGIYSFGASAAADRALGSLPSNATDSFQIGIRIVNGGTTTITSLAVSYTGEQWRNNGNATIQTNRVDYSTSATSLITGTWTNVSSLGFASPIHTTTAAATDGNAVANRAALSGTITVNIPPGSEIWIRSVDVNDAGNDHAMAMDDFSVTATFAALPACSGTPNQGTVAAGSSAICTGTTTTLNLSGATIASGITYQWQQSPDASSWSDVSTGSGFTTTTYTTPSLTSSTYYRCITTCTTSSLTATSTNSPSVTVVPNPSSGTITGGSAVCVGSNLTLATTGYPGGTWTPTSASGVATISGSTGVVRGVGPGTRIFTYTAPFTCGSATTTLSVTVNALPTSGSITPATPGVQVGGSITLTNPTSSAGTAAWSTVNGTGSVTITSGGVATGLSLGAATISYGITSAAGCGPVYTTRTIYINGPAPTIRSITPKSGIPGSAVSIYGTNFDATPGNNIVYFGATKATVNSGSTTTLSVTVPTGALYAPISVTTPTNYTAYSDTSFTPSFNNSGFIPNTLNFNPALIITAGGTPYSGAIGDLNGDNKPDLVVNNSGTVSGSGGPSISVFKNIMTGTGVISGSSFSLTSSFTGIIGTNTPNNVKLADIDGNGQLDIIVPLPDAAYILVYLNTTSGIGSNPTFAAPVSIAAGQFTSVAAIRDFDGDGKPDIALSAFLGSSTINILPNTSTVGSASFGSTIYILAGATPSSVCIADLDHDGLPDVACVNSGYSGGTYSGTTISIAKNTSTYGSITFGTSVSLTAGSGPLDIAAGDIDNDGKNDLVVTNSNSGNISVFINTSTPGTLTAGSFASAVNISSGSGSGSTPTGIALADMNGDSKLDVVVSNNNDNTVSVFRNLVTGSTVTLSLATPQNIATGQKPVTVTIGDLDGDGYPDIVTGNRGGASAATTNTFTILKNYPKPPIGTTSGASSLCMGASTTFSNTVTGGGWAVSNTTNATITSTGVLTGLNGGVDTVIYYTTFGGDSSFVYTTVTINPLPSPVLTGTATISSGASTTLTFTGTSGDVVYYWNGASTLNTTISGSGVSTVSVAPTVTTVYSVTSATSAFGCSQSISGVNITITVTSVPDTTPTRDDNMAMGNPSGATYSMSDSNNYLMVKSQFGLSYNNSKGEPNWVSWHLSRAWKGSAVRCDCFSPDATLPSGYFTATTSNYTGTGFDRGHLCPSDDRDGSDTDNAATFVMTNITPQAPNMNQITWGSLESYCRALIYAGNELYVTAGGYGAGGSGSLGGTTTTIAGTNITVPARFFKVIVVLPVGVNDVSRVANTTRVIAVDMPSNQTVNSQPWTYYRTSVDAIEAATGYDFLSNVPTGIQAVVEAGIDNGPSNILAWDFNGANSDTTIVATAASVGNNLDTSVTYNKLSRGATATASTGANSFRTTGFQNNGISTTNTDYFETKLKATSGYQLSLSSIAATFAGTSSFCASPGVSSQFAYSLDGTTFTLIGSPTINIGTPSVMASVNLTGVAALQNVSSTTPIYLRYYASGQTTSGGWGFFSQYVGNYGLSIDGTTQLEPCTTAPTSVTATLSSSAVCSGNTISLTGAVTSLGATVYTWSGPNGFTSTVLSPAAFTTSTASAGVYTLVAANSCGSTAATTGALTINVAPTSVTATPSATDVCNGSSLTLTGAATSAITTTYSWNGPGGFTSTDLSPAAITTNTNSAGVYTLVATNTCGSTTATSAAVTITVGSPTVAAISGSTSVVAGNNITLTNTTPSGVWVSGNTSMATVSASGMVHGLTTGTTLISYTVTNSCGSTTTTSTITVTPAPVTIAAWDFFGTSSPTTLTATVFNSALNSASGASAITRGSNAVTNGAGNSFRTTGFMDDGISTSNNDYFQITLRSTSGNVLSLSTIDARLAGTTTYAATPGVSNQFAYSLDGTTFTLIGSPQITVGTPATLTQIDVSGISPLQNLQMGTTVTIRYYATGQTSTGGWGFTSPSAGAYGLAIGGIMTTCSTFPTAVTATPSSTSICSGATLSLTGAATGAISYSWSGPNSFTSTALNTAPFTVNTASAGVYTLVASSSCGTTAATTAAITVNGNPTAVTATPTPAAVCSGSALTLTGAATGATSYSWSGPDGFTSTNLSPAAITTNTNSAGVYTLVATNSCGSTTTTTTAVTVTSGSPTVAAISGSTSVGTGNQITLTDATPSGTWGSTNVTIATVNASGVVTGLGAGVDTITYAVTNGCGTAAVSYTIIVTPGVATLVGWDVSGSTNYGTSPLMPSTTASHLVVTTNLTRGSGLSTPAGAAGRAWGGTVWNYTTAANAITANSFITFGFHSATGYTVSLNSYTLNYRRPGTGATAGQLQYSINGGSYTDVGSAISYASSSSSGATLSPVDLTGVSALQNLPSTSTVTFRLVNYAASASTGAWYIFDVANTTADDLFFTGVVAPNCYVAPTAVTATPSGTTVCSGSTVTLTGAATNADSYAWSGPASFSSTLQSPAFTASVTTAGVYTLVATNGCGSTTVTTTAISVNDAPTAVSASVTPTSLCYGGTITLTGTATGATVYSWSGPGGYTATDLNPAAITNASVSGVYTLTASNTCGTITATTASVTVFPLPSTSISGTASITYGATTTLTFTGVSGDLVYYSWTGGSNTNTTIGGTGSATVSVSPTLTTTYTIDSARSSAGCFAIITGASATVTVGPPCTSAPTGVSATLSSLTICPGDNVTLTGAATTSGPTTYSWSGPGGYTSTDLNPATFTGVAGTYTLAASNACGTTTATTGTLTINTAPTGVSATPSSTSVCTGSTLTLTAGATDATGYSWSGPNAFSSTLNPASVTTTTASAGVYTLTATNSCGSTTVTTTSITINGTPTVAAIAGATSVVIGNNITLTDATPSGTWSSSNTSIATVASSGMVHGSSLGTVVISYAVTGSCGTTTSTYSVSVNAASTTLAAWDFNSAVTGTPLATMAAAVFNSGLSTASSANNITRGAGAAASGAGSSFRTVGFQNNGISTANTDYFQVTLGATSGNNLSLATIDARFAGTGTFAASPGVSNQFAYSLDGTTFTLIGSPQVIVGTPSTLSQINLSGISALQNVPAGTTVTIRYYASGQTTTGGWGFISPSVGAYGLAIGGTLQCAGTPSAGSVAVTGPSTFCGSGSTSLTFTPATTNAGVTYQWNAGNSLSSSLAPVSGATSTTYTTPTLTDTTYYNVATTCNYSGLSASTSSATVTVNPSPVTPAAIAGTTSICVGTNTTLSDVTAGGTWSSTDPSVATIDASGVVTAIAAGTTTISYTMSTPSCGSAAATTTLTVNPAPSAGTIAGPATVCITTSSLFTSGVAGGAWTTSNASIASVDASGNVYGISAGNPLITYTVTNICGTAYDTAAVTVNTSASAGVISGGTAICPGTTTSLTTGLAGGTWSSLNNSIATVNGSGVVTGVAADTVTIVYTVTTACGTATATTVVTVNPILSAPAAITGIIPVCPGNATTLASATTGGAWSSSNTSIATVSGAGVVTGVAPGTATITYTITNLCGSAYTTTPFTVNSVPVVGAITGAATVCSGSSITLSDTTAGGTWTSATPAVATINASTGVVSGLTVGSAVISYSVTNVCGTTITTTSVAVITTPVLAAITGSITVYNGATTTLSNTTSGGTWVSANTTLATVSASGVVTGVSLGSTVISYTVTNSCGSTTVTKSISVLTPVTAASVLWNFTAGSGATSPAATSTSTEVLASNCIASVGNVTGTITAISSTSPSTTLSGYSGGNNIGNTAAGGGLSSSSAYMQFTITPNSGYFINLTGMSFGNRCTGTGPQAYSVRSSADGFSSVIATGTTLTNSTWQTITPSFTSAITGGASTSITIRVYGHSGSGSASGTIVWRMDDVNINFTANPNICSGTPAAGTAAITGSAAACGTGSTSLTFTPGANALGTTYQWTESTTATGTFTPIAGATSATYTTPTLTDTAYYVTTTTCNYSGLSANTSVNTVNINALPTIALSAAMPTVCQPTTSAPVSFSASTGGPTNYNIDWDATANTAGFTDVTGAILTGSSLPIIMPATGAVGSFTGSLTVSNGMCTSAPYTVTTTILAYPTATVTSLDVPCVGHSGVVYITGTPANTISYMVDSGSVINSTISAGGSFTISTGVISTPHNYSIVSVANAVCTTYVDTVVYVNPTPMQWIGGSAGHLTDWNYAGNWGCNTIPTISDNVTVDSGTYVPVISGTTPVNALDLKLGQGATLVLNTGAVLNVKGMIDNNGTVSGDGRVIMNNTTAQTIKGRGTISNLELNNVSGAAVDSGARLVISNTLYITSGTLTTSDSLELASTDSVTTARIAELPAFGGSISGKVKVDQYVQGHYRRFRFWSHPFDAALSLSQVQSFIDITGPGGSANGFRSTSSNAPSAFRLDPYTENDTLGYDPGWKPFTKINAAAADSNKVQRYQGIRLFFRGKKGEGLGYLGYYGMYNPSATTVKMLGNINQGPQTAFMQQGSLDPTHQSFNMMGNPYPSPIDIGEVIWRAAQSGNVQGAAFYVWDPTYSAGGNFITIPIGTTSPIHYNLSANTCFQVRAGHDGDSLNFVESDKVSSFDNYLFKAPSDYLTLNVYDSNYHIWDAVNVQFNDKATDVEDSKYDAVKQLNADFTFYSLSADKRKLAIDARPFESEKVVPLGITSAYDQRFIIRADNVAVPKGSTVFLHDKLLNKLTELKPSTEYAFTISKDKATQGDARFELSLKAATAATDNGLHVTMTPNPASDDVHITFTTTQKENVSVRVMDISGVNVYNKDLGVLQNGTVNVSLSNLAAGIYMVELTSGDKKVLHRLVKE